MALGLKLSPHQRSVDRLSWDTCRWNAPALPQELVLGPSSLSIQDDVEGWQVSSDEVQLPGLVQRFLGMAPSRNPRPSPGRLESSPCVDVGARWLGKLEPCWEAPRIGTVLVDMVRDPDAWELTGQGPCGLTLTAGGDATIGLRKPVWTNSPGMGRRGRDGRVHRAD